MQMFDQAAVAAALPYDRLIDALDQAFQTGVTAPQRSQHAIPQASGDDATLLLMPAWREQGDLGVKMISVFPDNARYKLGSVNGLYVLLDGKTGVPRAVMDGNELTLRRTASASALASRYLSPEEASSMLMVGTGKLSPHLIAAHAAVRPLTTLRVWGRDYAKAEALAARFADRFSDVAAVENLKEATASAAIVSCATLSQTPLVKGADLRPGQHLDLVGAYRPDMAEADPEALGRARVVVDTYEGARHEAGDVLQAIDAGVMSIEQITADLAELTAGKVVGRESPEDITLFKSVGTALEDLVAAELVAQSVSSAVTS